LESTPKGRLEAIGLGKDALASRHPTLIHARITPFGDEGPWSDFKACDLVHLALGGVMMNCGYDPAPGGKYDLPPIAPQMWHAYHIAGEQLSMAILAALMYRHRTGQGQHVSCAVHEAVSKCTEVDLMTWVMASLGNRPDDGEKLIALMEKYGIEPGLDAETAKTARVGRFVPGTAPDKASRDQAMEAVTRFVRAFTYENIPWREAQQSGMLWAPLRKPHENALDAHWIKRGSVCDVEHPELGRSFRYATSKWIGTATRWMPGRRAPRLDEDAGTLD